MSLVPWTLSPLQDQVFAFLDSLTKSPLISADFTSLSGAADAWELESFGPGGPIFTEVQAEQTALRTAAKSLADSLTQLRSCVATPGTCKNVYDTIAGVLAGGTIGGPLVWLYTYNGNPTSPTQTSQGSPPAAEPTETSSPQEWLINTVPRTSVKDFQAFIKTLPDRGSGKQLIWDTIDVQGYVTKMTRLEAQITNLDPIVDIIISNDPIQFIPAFVNNTSPSGLRQRDDNVKIVGEDDELRYQYLLCTPKDQNIDELSDNEEDWIYVHEESAGDGTFVYVFDAGFRFSHDVCPSHPLCCVSPYD